MAANPDSLPMSLDFRLMLSSLAFLSGMQVSAMSEFARWSSAQVLRRHYLHGVLAVQSSAVVLGRRLDDPVGSST